MSRKQIKIETWLRVAKLIGQNLSTCISKQVGCVLLNSNYEVISTGVNGVASGKPHCCDINKDITREQHGHFADLNEIHAEENAIFQAFGSSLSLRGGICLTSLQPCFICLKHLHRVGIKEVYYLEEYRRNDQVEYREHILVNIPGMMVEKVELINNEESHQEPCS